jgi:hypothetical protein
MTVHAADPGQAAVIAWDAFRVAAGEDTAAWDMASASDEIQPLSWSVSTRTPRQPQ